MSMEQGEDEGAPKPSSEDPKKMKPPNKKKFDEDMDGLTSQIKEKEAELERVRQIGMDIKRLRSERTDYANRRKSIVVDLEKLNKEIPDRMKRLHEIEASLYYKSEDKINSAIQRLEWNLRAKTYKLIEEKKIVSEIDSLKRSKKNLVQYTTLRQEISEIRDRQKSMRDERDRCTKEFNRLKSKEDGLRSQGRSLAALKKEIDSLYDQRRQTNQTFKQQRGEFQELKEKQKKGSWKKKVEERKAYEEERRREMAELEAERLPHETDLHLCVTLASYLNRLLPTDTYQESLSPSSSQDDPEPAEEMGDGQFKLLKKSDDADLDYSQGGGIRRLSKRNRKIRKTSMDKKIAHPSDVLNQFMSLNLMAPTCLFEVPEVLEQLQIKQTFFEKEQQLCEATSDAGISATESGLCVMSRQASKTESCEGVQEISSRPDDSVYAALFQQQDKSSDAPGQDDELRGAVGGRTEDEDWSPVVVSVGSDTPNSDSTIEGDASSGESQKVRQLSGGFRIDCLQQERNRHQQQEQHTAPERPELKRSLALTVSNSTDSSLLTDQMVQAMSLEDDLLSDASFPSLGASGSGVSPRQESHPTLATSPRSSTHRTLTKTVSLVPEDLCRGNTSSSSGNQVAKKSYASSLVSRTRSFSEVTTRKPGSGGVVSADVTAAVWSQKPAKGAQRSVPTSVKQTQPQPPSSLSLSSSANLTSSMTPSPSAASSFSSKQRPSIHRSRTLTPTLTRSWVEVRNRDRKSGDGKSNIAERASPGGGLAKSPSKMLVGPSLSSSIPAPHRSTLSPRLSLPFQSKSTPSQPVIVINDDKDFPPLGQTGSAVRRNSNLSTKSSTGSLPLHDHTTQHSSDNNNNQQQASPPLAPPQTATTTIATVHHSTATTSTSTSAWFNQQQQHHHHLLQQQQQQQQLLSANNTKSTVAKTDSGDVANYIPASANMDPVRGLSSIPRGDKSSTEKWVESSIVFVQDMATASQLTEDSDTNVASL